MLWLEEMLDLGQKRYMEKMFADPRNPRVLVVRSVGEAVRENLSDPPLGPELLERAVREAQKQADMLIVLILHLQDQVCCELRRHDPYAQLLFEQYRRMLLEQSMSRRSPPEDWDCWRALLIGRLITLGRLRKTVRAISARYYDGHRLLFATGENRLDCEIEVLEELAQHYNGMNGELSNWEVINIDVHSSSMAEQVEAQVEHYVTLATARTLAAFGEQEPARELLDSVAHHALRELKRLRSSSSPRENSTT